MPIVRTIEVLREARERIEDPKRWTSIAWARDGDNGPHVAVDAHYANCWCAAGSVRLSGIRRGLNVSDMLPLDSALDVISLREYGRPSLFEVNDYVGRLAAIRVLQAAEQELVDRGEK
jgi:hypothetical protein